MKINVKMNKFHQLLQSSIWFIYEKKKYHNTFTYNVHINKLKKTIPCPKWDPERTIIQNISTNPTPQKTAEFKLITVFFK